LTSRAAEGASAHDPYIDLGGTIRSRDAAATLRWLEPLFPRFGLTRVARVTGLDDVGIAVSMAVRPLSQSLSVSQGKGMSPELSDASAVMESIELWHSENAPPHRVFGSYEALRARGEPAVDVVGLRPEGVFLPPKDLRSCPFGWLEGHDLVSGERRFVPRPFCAIGTDRAELAHFTSHVDSTGLAGGNTIEEATCHALCEVIERDATARFAALSRDEKDARELDLESVTGPARDLVTRLERTRLRVRLWNQTSHVDVPAFGCSIEGVAEIRGLARFVGFGAHLDPEIAVCRAVCEAAQSRLTTISGARDDQLPATYSAMQFFEPSGKPPSPPKHSFADAPKRRMSGTFGGDVRFLVQTLRAKGFAEVIRVDLTKPEIGVPVVWVFVPHALVLAH
jgi:YcaO-like protein with predicted kinase domain